MNKLFTLTPEETTLPTVSFDEALVALEELHDDLTDPSLDSYQQALDDGLAGVEALTDTLERLHNVEQPSPELVKATTAHVTYVLKSLGYPDEAQEVIGLESLVDNKEESIAGLEEKKDGVLKRIREALMKFLSKMMKRIKKSALGKFLNSKFKAIYARLVAIPDYIVGMDLEANIGFSSMLSLGQFVDDYVAVCKDMERVLDHIDWATYTFATGIKVVQIVPTIEIRLNLTTFGIVNKTDFSIPRKIKINPVQDYIVLLEIMGIEAKGDPQDPKQITYKEHPVLKKIDKGIAKLAKLATDMQLPQPLLTNLKSLALAHKSYRDYVELGPRVVVRSISNIVKAAEEKRKERRS